MEEKGSLVQEGFAAIHTELYGYSFEAVTNKDIWRGLILRLFTILIILFLLLFLIEKLIEKFLGVKRRRISETPGKSVDRWGRTIILIIFLVVYFFALTKGSVDTLKWYWVLFLTVLAGFQIILEWKYLKESKQYISTLISSTICFIFIIFFVIRFYN
ncbi:DUF4181 domain-containing protein [Bacillus sp. FJAT-27916]|uniref:DUF4181 domain-containing protein n=1 Tax=Bacillus sp. FJAT-27916 TaxID=1679169 RepID=UPI0009E44D7F|nr:DUF4181 domain-containing protein [Bacillus sp. FJAT-27916]